jgi:hypothetical protein
LQAAFCDLDSGIAQVLKAASAYLGVGVAASANHSGYTGCCQGVGTGGGAAKMAAGFKSDVSGGTLSLIARHAQSVDFGMGTSGLLVPAFTHQGIILNDDAANPGVGAGGIEPLLCQT